MQITTINKNGLSREWILYVNLITTSLQEKSIKIHSNVDLYNKKLSIFVLYIIASCFSFTNDTSRPSNDTLQYKLMNN